jgi:hypothetical protein
MNITGRSPAALDTHTCTYEGQGSRDNYLRPGIQECANFTFGEIHVEKRNESKTEIWTGIGLLLHKDNTLGLIFEYKTKFDSPLVGARRP